jgi:hypothetical protein
MQETLTSTTKWKILSRTYALSFSVAWNTPGMHIYKMRFVTRERCSLRYTHIYKTQRFHNRNETYATQQDWCPTINYQQTTATTGQYATILNYKRGVQFEVAVLWLVPARSWGWRRCWHLLSRTGNTCLSIQSLVPVTTFRCHFLFPLLSYHRYTPLKGGEWQYAGEACRLLCKAKTQRSQWGDVVVSWCVTLRRVDALAVRVVCKCTCVAFPFVKWTVIVGVWSSGKLAYDVEVSSWAGLRSCLQIHVRCSNVREQWSWMFFVCVTWMIIMRQ